MEEAVVMYVREVSIWCKGTHADSGKSPGSWQKERSARIASVICLMKRLYVSNLGGTAEE